MANIRRMYGKLWMSRICTVKWNKSVHLSAWVSFLCLLNDLVVISAWFGLRAFRVTIGCLRQWDLPVGRKLCHACLPSPLPSWFDILKWPLDPCRTRGVRPGSDSWIGHKVRDLWPLNSMKSVEWASKIMLKVNQWTGIWKKNRRSSNWSRFSSAEIGTSVDEVSNFLFFC